jgi:hypothetical protein
VQDRIEIFHNIAIDDPGVAAAARIGDPRHCLLDRTARPVGKARLVHLRFEDRAESDRGRGLDHPVGKARDRERARAAVRFRDIDPAQRPWQIGAAPQRAMQFEQAVADIGGKCRDRDAITARPAGIAPHPFPALIQQWQPGDRLEQIGRRRFGRTGGVAGQGDMLAHARNPARSRAAAPEGNIAGAGRVEIRYPVENSGGMCNSATRGGVRTGKNVRSPTPLVESALFSQAAGTC